MVGMKKDIEATDSTFDITAYKEGVQSKQAIKVKVVLLT